jgi:hypothetical protein
MLKRRLTLIFKVDNPLRMIRPAIIGGDKIMRNFNILRRDRRRNRIPFLPIDFFWRRQNRRARNRESPQSLTMY